MTQDISLTARALQISCFQPERFVVKDIPLTADNEIFGKNVKYAVGQFRERIDDVGRSPNKSLIPSIEAKINGAVGRRVYRK